MLTQQGCSPEHCCYTLPFGAQCSPGVHTVVERPGNIIDILQNGHKSIRMNSEFENCTPFCVSNVSSPSFTPPPRAPLKSPVRSHL